MDKYEVWLSHEVSCWDIFDNENIWSVSIKHSLKTTHLMQRVITRCRGQHVVVTYKGLGHSNQDYSGVVEENFSGVQEEFTLEVVEEYFLHLYLPF